MLADDQLHAAPSYLATKVSHLSSFFKRLGRDGQYNHGTLVRGLQAAAPLPCAQHCRLGTPAWTTLFRP